jgi:hypothetical protein
MIREGAVSGEDEGAARTKDVVGLEEVVLGVGDVFEDLRGEDEVEVSGDGWREAAVGGDGEVDGGGVREVGAEVGGGGEEESVRGTAGTEVECFLRAGGDGGFEGGEEVEEMEVELVAGLRGGALAEVVCRGESSGVRGLGGMGRRSHGAACGDSSNSSKRAV